MSLTTSAPSKTALVVLGMCQSGTTVLSGVLGHLGAALPQHLMTSAEMGINEGAEINRFARLNERLLQRVGFTRGDLLHFPSEWFDSSDAADLLNEAVELLTAEYGDASMFVINDPQICRLMPFWRAALNRFGARTLVVHNHNTAKRVAESLNRCKGYETEFGLALWARHVLDAEAESRDFPRSFTCDDALLTDWRATMLGIAADLEIDWPRPVEEVAPDIDQFLLQHSPAVITGDTDHPPQLPMLARIDEILQDMKSGADPAKNSAELDWLRAALDAIGPLFGPMANRAQAHAREIRQLHNRIDELQAEIASIQADYRLLSEQFCAATDRAARATQSVANRDAEIGNLSQQLLSVNRQLHVASAQLRQFAKQQALEIPGRIDLAVALNDPTALLDQLPQLRERVENATAVFEAQREQLCERIEHLEKQEAELTAKYNDALEWGLRREAELLSSASWRVTAPLRALSRAVRRLRR